MTDLDDLLTTSEMAEADRLAIAAGVPSLKLMESAGAAVAEAAIQMLRGRPNARIAILCGPGNNGGDGFVAARYLSEKNFDVRVSLLGERSALKGDAAEMARRWLLPLRPATEDALQSMSLVIDAIFGAGLSRGPEGAAADLIEAVNASGIPVLSVDVPSGLDGSTGQVSIPCIKAKRTITFFRKKPGHVLMPGRAFCGHVTVAQIGIPESVLGEIKSGIRENTPAGWLSELPQLEDGGHKYDRGHAVVLSGPPHQTGAARLSARGALRVGAGVVTVIGTSAATAMNATQLTAIMVYPVNGSAALKEFLSDKRRNAVLVGPGAPVGADTAGDVLTILKSQAAAVLDAGALTSFSSGNADSEANIGFLHRATESAATPAALFEAIKGRAEPVIMTPHEGEFKRLFGDLEGSKLDRARAAAAQSGAIVILKGSDTVIAAPDGRAAINSNAPPTLATAGSGDVLAGFVLGLLAQHMSAFEAACAAVWLHGDCARRFGTGLIAEDIPEIMPEALRALKDGVSE
ncbi:bifunctional ADP-dependent NAD(P)H-hydrate dehydratase/NAD(P)H-hydrate epimerase [Hyphomicrobium methylovorum]|uniref:NAD(P)H-hydrate dehydratase n=1 Tax=Hyphomicrobium methylovorum TaxID=84 RepID=UPI0015E70FD9|nr:NAD(P)H-hydrate dehydratase [Hyphomicrobium methylovorum]MBA2125238.1 bifunctional ADP-dependent NAD(P)H-hydrate dehydratase/NAD(P)H-hydrate epimerase [Hyphomicrobium methylovorum]